MKINTLLLYSIVEKSQFKECFRIMRISFIFLFVCAFHMVATNTDAQNVKIEINTENMTVRQLINEIEKQTEYLILFRNNDVDTERVLHINNSSAKVSSYLDEAFNGTDIEYYFQNKYILLSKKGSDGSHPFQQGRIISGTIVDERGDPVIGANVIEKGTTNGVVTDIDGKFSLHVANDAVILFSYIGYVEQEVMVGDRTYFDIVMKEDTQTLDEVVVVGYGTQKRSNVTGSVASIKADDFNDLNMGVTAAIQGRVAGVNVSNGNIVIRGAASINGADPLWIVDGVPGDAPNFNDIESVEILKDAASTAIYGARGAGGVILVTTKKGKTGKLTINARANVGVSMPIDLPDMLKTPDFIDRKLAAGFPNSAGSGWDNPSSLPDTNWEDEVWRNAFRQNYFIQMTGGNEKTTFNMSGEFFRNEYIERYSSEDGGNIRVASQTKINDKIKFSEVIRLGHNNADPHLYGNESHSYTYYRQVPTMTPYDKNNENGGGWGRQPSGGYYEGPNPLATLRSRHANNKSYWARANVILDWEIIKGLQLQANLSANFDSYANNEFQESWNLGSLTQQERFTKNYGSGHNFRMLYTLTYDRTFAEKHYIKGMAGYEAYKAVSSTSGGWKTGFMVQPAEDIGLGTGDKDVTGGKGQNRSLSQFARLNYAYDDKYLFEASIRRDGYDNFGPENRFGVFPSASAGWNIARESFIRDNVDWITQLKLRGSYGRIGNNTIAQFLYESAFTNNFLFYSYDSENTQRGFWYSHVANSAIKWEDVAQWNIGIDAGFLNNRLNTTIEYYDKKTSDMLYSVGVPPSAGPSAEPFSTSASYKANIGEISNKGIEWMIQWRDSYKDFSYDVAFTLSTNKNKVIRLSDQVNPIIWAGSVQALNSSIYRTENSQPMGQMYGYVVDGIFQEQSEIDALNNASPDGLYQQAGTAPGDFKYRDINGDGKITNEDKTYIGNPWPELVYGLNISMSWKGFDLMMGWLGNSGVDVFNGTKVYERSFYGDYNTTYKVYDAWSTTNRNTKHPRVTRDDPNGNFKNVSSYFVEDGSFLKLKNLHFGYNLPKSFLNKFNLSGMKIFVNCDNLFIITKFQGDPELGGGYLERNKYTDRRGPATRTIMGGLSLTL